jgi:hypothetical protein
MQFHCDGDMVKVMRLLVLLGLATGCFWSACGDAANTQYIPIGTRCGSNGDCGTSPYRCALPPMFPSGYCEKDCASGMDCPTDSVCINGECRRSCVSDTDPDKGCRVNEGYVCKSEQNVLVCDLP